MAKKEEVFEKETKYCKIIKSVTLVNGNETFALEKIYIKSLDRYEIRIALYKDCRDRAQKFVARAVDMEEDQLITLISLGIKAGILSKEFKGSI
ncbi:TPA: hypothetical protein ACKONR_001183 [Clostridioides difficile]|uniref:hypothetical protein n=1 Tax=Clostridioides difficile TaxID=1496 RepID=UPI00097FE0A0|nr:hypothetical protein [Clostridioides difficile]AXU29194.1 hypothetical protein CDIF102859_03531 [Clostridioides difficile]AXU32982.1 hypothetical protein CDIF102860_03546 [Clostridioides difficile]AXU36770.1 hypothetical protein CDIF102978_03546 [Clostridioides difficile]MCP8413124.1 hypothetical protein [Clostridioides difficile]MDC9390859.1 hypothetical protein [Clostridioides difficile]